MCQCLINLPVWALIGTAAGLVVALAVFGIVFLIPVIPVLKRQRKNQTNSDRSESAKTDGQGGGTEGKQPEKDDC